VNTECTAGSHRPALGDRPTGRAAGLVEVENVVRRVVEKRVRAHYSYDFVGFVMHRSRSWVAHRASAGDIETADGRVPLREVLRLTDLSIEEFTDIYGEDLVVDAAS
jgi:hypothetical protein